MPELPEVETMARVLHASVVRGATIDDVQVYRSNVLRDCTAKSLKHRAEGATFDRFWRRAKYVVGELSTGDRIVVSPRFTGSLDIERGGWHNARGDYTVIVFALKDGNALRYRDVRRLGTVALMSPNRFTEWEGAMGPEPLEATFTPAVFAKNVRSSSRAIKTVLMDQRRVAGIGNIYANEALWHAKIRPSRRASTLTLAESGRLHKESVAVLRSAVDQGGTSFRDYRDPNGERGGFLGLAKVYSRQGQPCVRCGTTLKSSHAIENRITVWCTGCQK
ncbi:MAG: bifunctional DNA-formamidopyrimidine glycosylase/DNA-(apurinic or apyrimidinic site) lyase [Gemmatimonadetes bacterium]|nr:bifunctional DNA-formamidopyrimidine glycosylase/DNA-(apurinic or apyrimidinic site) lyase [Gemmatimonadota bacterium]